MYKTFGLKWSRMKYNQKCLVMITICVLLKVADPSSLKTSLDVSNDVLTPL